MHPPTSNTKMPEQIAFLGLGAMGFGMATSLLSKSHTVTGFDIWAPTLARFQSAGGLTETTPRSTVKDKKFVVLMVATAVQVDDALFAPNTGAVHELVNGAVVILCSTGPPGYTLDVKTKLMEYGRGDVKIVDAPVSGGTARAANGTLTILASGDEESLDVAMPILNDMSGGLAKEGKGGNLWVIPGGLGQGTKVKMVHQVLAAIGVVGVSEVMGFVAKLGLGTKESFDVLCKSEGWNWMFENRGSHMFEDGTKVYSAMNIMVKDIGIVTGGGRTSSFPLFLSSTTEQVLFSGVSAGYGLLDDSQIFKVYLPQQPNLIFESATSTATDPAKLKMVENLLKGLNLATACEAMALGKKVGLDAQTLYEIIKDAAGGSWVFQHQMPQLISGVWKEGKSVSEVVGELKAAVEAAHDLKYPLHLAGTALQLFQLAELRGWGKEEALAVVKIWDGEDEALFPRSS